MDSYEIADHTGDSRTVAKWHNLIIFAIFRLLERPYLCPLLDANRSQGTQFVEKLAESSRFEQVFFISESKCVEEYVLSEFER